MDASVASAIDGCADALKACDQGLHISRSAVVRCFLSKPNQGEKDATAVVIQSTFHRGGYKLYSNFAFLFSTVVIK